MNGVRHPVPGDEDRQARLVTGPFAGMNLVIAHVSHGLVSLLTPSGVGLPDVPADRVFIFDPEDP